jgi:hypothetical protein
MIYLLLLAEFKFLPTFLADLDDVRVIVQSLIAPGSMEVGISHFYEGLLFDWLKLVAVVALKKFTALHFLHSGTSMQR